MHNIGGVLIESWSTLFALLERANEFDYDLLLTLLFPILWYTKGWQGKSWLSRMTMDHTRIL